MTTIEFNNGTAYLTHVSSVFAGYGHRKMTCEFKDTHGNEESFTCTFTNIDDYENALEIDSWEDQKIAMYEVIASKIEEEIENWLAVSALFYVIEWNNGKGKVFYDGFGETGTALLDNAMRFKTENDAEAYMSQDGEFSSYCYVANYEY